MEVVFDNPFGSEYDYLGASYQKIAETAFSILGVEKDYEIDVSLVDDKTIQAINRDYRKTDRVTDVISFAFLDDKDPRGRIEGDVREMLGEILICLPQAKRQAKEIGNSEGRELCFLFTHGLLHLLGYDHMSKEEEAVMFPLQERILTEAGKDLWTKKA
jgi:probable rRNA maturation factor